MKKKDFMTWRNMDFLKTKYFIQIKVLWKLDQNDFSHQCWFLLYVCGRDVAVLVGVQLVSSRLN